MREAFPSGQYPAPLDSRKAEVQRPCQQWCQGPNEVDRDSRSEESERHLQWRIANGCGRAAASRKYCRESGLMQFHSGFAARPPVLFQKQADGKMLSELES